jgi:hypothetical protein
MRRLIIFIILVIVLWCCLGPLLSPVQIPEANPIPQPAQVSPREPNPQPLVGNEEHVWVLIEDLAVNIADTLSSLHNLMVGLVNGLDQTVPEPLQWICGGGWLVIIVLIVAGAIALRFVTFIADVLNL